jgi:phosphate acetyltransferase
MFDFEGNLESQLQKMNKPKPTFIFPEWHDPRVILAVSKLLPFIQILLPTTAGEFSRNIKTQNLVLDFSVDDLISQIKFADVAVLTDTRKAFGATLSRNSEGKKWQMDEIAASQLMEDPLNFSIMAIHEGFADAILGGLLFTSKDYFIPCLRMLKKEKTVFELALFVLPDEHPRGIFRKNIAVFSDVAINLAPDAESLANIAVGTCKIVRDLVPEKVLPLIYGAMISYSTKGSGAGPAVEVVAQAGALIPEKLAQLALENVRYATIHLDWELQLSVAVSEKTARKKIPGYNENSPAGHANVLIAPNLDLGNALYHLYATTWPKASKLLQVGGIYGQALDFSRSSTAEDVVLAAKALALQHLKRTDFGGTPKLF